MGMMAIPIPCVRALRIIVGLHLLFLSLWGCDHDGPTVKTVEVKEYACPLPSSLPKVDQDKANKFGTEVTGIVKYIGGVKFDSELNDKIKKEYPAADDVNRIYALSFAACVSCRINPSEAKDCAKKFDKIIDDYTAKRVESPASTEAEEYRARLLKPFLE